MKKIAAILFFLLVFSFYYSFSQTTGEEVFEGYICDVLCGVKGKDLGNENLIKNPQKHTVACMKMSSCAKSGFGIFIKDKGKDTYTFYRFAKAGNSLAYKNIIEKTTKKEGVFIEVKGTLKNKTITLTSIIEK
ncbi:MAG: hypothetical protein A2Y34_14325 [Spirochaetes bacterium GWC1_27_15]|nr:MAG: hypothetical protein A2Z98_00620 [Spirochaetes bacterium GWB1_27_13]OHD20543.1 MAG: hypothetical protein A2Y34_14325 [Spirochaetes bacterium GWC1_27_15]